MLLPYKIKIICAVWLLSSMQFLTAGAQELKLVKKWKSYVHQVSLDSSYKMIELRSLDTGFVYDLRYATPGNFTGKQLYKQGKLTYLRQEPAQALAGALAELRSRGMVVKIFDAYRPYSTTKKMWELVKDERYVANPAKGSAHNRGLAVDLTLVDMVTGNELDMGTGFDHFSDTAHHGFKDLPLKVLENRKLLKEIMEKAGFRALSTEWWHYSWPNNRNYDVFDIDFKKFRKESF